MMTGSCSIPIKKKYNKAHYAVNKTPSVLPREGGVGPYGFCEISRRVKSLNYFKNMPVERVYDFVYDHKHKIMAINILKERPALRIAFGHDGIRRAFSMRESDIVGGGLKRFKGGYFGTSEWSGHYGHGYWTDEIRGQFIQFLIQDLQLCIYHLPGIDVSRRDIVGLARQQAEQFALLEKLVTGHGQEKNFNLQQMLAGEYIASGQFSAAKKHLATLAANSTKLPTERNLELWYCLGQYYHNLGGYQQAIFYKKLLLQGCILLFGRESQSVATVLLSLSESYEMIVLLDKAMACVEAGKDIYFKLYKLSKCDEVILGLTRAFSVKARVHRLNTNFKQASSCLKLSENCCGKIQSKWIQDKAHEFLRFEQNALYGASSGRYGAAQGFNTILESHKILRAGAHYLEELQVMLNTAHHEKDNDRAISLFNKVIALSEKHYPTKVNPIRVRAHLGLAVFYYSKKRSESELVEMLKHAKLALSLSLQLGKTFNLLEIYRTVGACHDAVEKFLEAESYYKAALKLCENFTLSENHLEYALLYYSIADNYYQREKWAEVYEYAAKAVKVFSNRFDLSRVNQYAFAFILQQLTEACCNLNKGSGRDIFKVYEMLGYSEQLKDVSVRCELDKHPLIQLEIKSLPDWYNGLCWEEGPVLLVFGLENFEMTLYTKLRIAEQYINKKAYYSALPLLEVVRRLADIDTFPVSLELQFKITIALATNYENINRIDQAASLLEAFNKKLKQHPDPALLNKLTAQLNKLKNTRKKRMSVKLNQTASSGGFNQQILKHAALLQNLGRLRVNLPKPMSSLFFHSSSSSVESQASTLGVNQSERPSSSGKDPMPG